MKLNPAGSVLIAMYGATIGKIGILKFPATTNQACCACVEFNSVRPLYLFYFLMANRDSFIEMGGGRAQPNISKEKIIDTFIPIPPIDEQKRIIDAITHYFSKITTVEREQLELRKYVITSKTKILDLALSGRLTSNTSHYPQLPDGAMKILHPKIDIDLKYIAYFMSITRLVGTTHKRYWISEYSKIKVPVPPKEEQDKIVFLIE